MSFENKVETKYQIEEKARYKHMLVQVHACCPWKYTSNKNNLFILCQVNSIDMYEKSCFWHLFLYHNSETYSK